jgi:hypothetical protein
LGGENIEDAFRNEPRNIGVIVSLHGRIGARFVGERDDGVFDNRKVGNKFIYPAVYSQWRDFWQKKVASGNLDEIVEAVTANFYVEVGGNVSDTGSDSVLEVTQFLFNLLVGGGVAEAYEWDDVTDSSVDLASEITEALSGLELLAKNDQLFVRHPVLREAQIQGKHISHRPSFSQRNGKLYVIEYIDFNARRAHKIKERAGYMAYMFSDIRSFEGNSEAFSIVRPEVKGGADQIQYAKGLLEGESRLVNWADDRERNGFLEQRRLVADTLGIN